MLKEHCQRVEKKGNGMIRRLIFFPDGDTMQSRSRFQRTKTELRVMMVLRCAFDKEHIADAAFGKQDLCSY